jgi:predicted O-linked N-acetylglucosamine transferase (SPINDLY family)
MGVPVITLAGNGYASRQGVSLLTNVNLTDWIAGTPEEYVAIAVRWSASLDRLEDLRGRLRERMRESPVCDEEGFTHALEESYRRMWRRWCAS